MAKMKMKSDRDRGGGSGGGGRGAFASMESLLEEDDDEEEARYNDDLHGRGNETGGSGGRSTSRDQKLKRNKSSSTAPLSNEILSSKTSATTSVAAMASRTTALAKAVTAKHREGKGIGMLSMWKDNNENRKNEPTDDMEDPETAAAAKKKEGPAIMMDLKHQQEYNPDLDAKYNDYEDDYYEEEDDKNVDDVDLVVFKGSEEERREREENNRRLYQQQSEQHKIADRHQHDMNFGNAEEDSLPPSDTEPFVAKKTQKNSKRCQQQRRRSSEQDRKKMQEAAQPEVDEHKNLEGQKEIIENKSLRPRDVRGRLVQEDHHQQQHAEGTEESFKLIEPSPPDFGFCAQDDDDDDDSHKLNQGIQDESLEVFHDGDAQPPAVTQRYGGGSKLWKKRKSMPSQPQIQQGLENERKKRRRKSDLTSHRDNRDQSRDGNDLASCSTKKKKKKFDESDPLEVKPVRSKSVVGLRPSHWAKDSTQFNKASKSKATSDNQSASNNQRLSRAAALAAATRKRTPKQKKRKAIPPTKDSMSSNEKKTCQNGDDHPANCALQTPRDKASTSDRLGTTSKAKSDIKQDGGFSISFAPAFIHRTAIKAAKGGDVLVDNDQDNGTGVHWTAPPTRMADLLSPPPSAGKRRQVSNGQWARRLAALQLPKTHPSLSPKDHVAELETHLNHIVVSATTNTEKNSPWAEDQENLNNLLIYLNGLVGTPLLHAVIVLLDTALADIQNHHANPASKFDAIENECLFAKITAPSGRCVHFVRGSKGEETYLCLLSKQRSTNESTANQNDHASSVPQPASSSPSSRRPANYCTCRSFFDKATKPEPLQPDPVTAIHSTPIQYQSPLCKHLLALKLIHVLQECSGSGTSENETPPRNKFVKNQRTSTETEFSKLILDRTMGY